MVQPRLAGCARAALRHSRGFRSSSQTCAPLSVANLLDGSPADPDHVVVNGFVRSLRNQKTRSFANIGDGSSLEPLQALLTPVQAESLSTGTAVRLTGQWRPSPNPKAQTHELHVVDVDVLGTSDPATFPLQKKYHSPEFLRTMPHIRPRTPLNSAMLRLRSQSIAQLTQFFAERDFTQTHPPIITSSDCEGAGETFIVSTADKKRGKVSEEDDGSFFRSPKYLTVSSQLHLEALAQSVGKVWTLSPTFRAEKSDTARHLSEFYMLEAEMSFVESMGELMDLIEEMLQFMTKGLHQSKVAQEILHGKRANENGLEKDLALSEELERRWQGMMSGSWPRITYTRAISLLQESHEAFEHKPEWGSGLQAEHERYIASTVGQGKPVFVTSYPKSIKPFYMSPSASTELGETVECFDLLVPEVCEIIGGSMREHRLQELIDSMRAHGLLSGEQQGLELEDAAGSLKWYVELRKWGTVPHGGFGLGFDRLLGYLSGVQNIREVVTFPRWVGRCEC